MVAERKPNFGDRTCPKCATDGVSEKVGWGYWFCHRCSNVWEVLAEAGKRGPVVTPTKATTRDETVYSKKPLPGKLSTSDGLDFPLT